MSDHQSSRWPRCMCGRAARALLLLPLLCLAARQAQGAGPRAQDVIPDVLGPVEVTPGNPGASSASQKYEDLSLVYDDFRRIKTRPLLHLEAKGMAETSPQLMLFAAFLDTRPLYYGKAAVLRLMALKFEPKDVDTPDVYCKYLVEGQDSYYTSKAHGPLRVNTNDAGGWPYRDVIYTCQTNIDSIAAIEAAAAGGQPLLLPRFATLVASPNQEVGHDLSWVHVSGIPLVHERAADINHVLRAAREPMGGPYLSPEQYHAGKGEVAVCAGPMYGADHHAGVLAEWAEFQKIVGVSKVFIYDYSMGRVSRHYINLYEAEGFFEVHEYMLSKRLLQPGEQKAEDCREKFVSEPKRDGLMSGEWVAGCADDSLRVYLRAESAIRLHCTYSAAGRYRWVAVADLDEWLVPRLQPPVTWTGLFKQAVADAPTGFAKFGYQYNASLDNFRNEYDGTQSPFPSSFMFLNTFVCSVCAATQHLAPCNTSVNRDQVLMAVPPKPDLDPMLRIPRPSMHPVTWSAVRAEVQRPMDRVKSVTDPLAVMSHYAHCPWSYWYMEGGTLHIPTTPAFQLSEDVALLYHVRVSHVSGLEAHDAVHNPHQQPQPFALHSCGAPGCGSPFKWRYSTLFEDWTIANLYGQQLVAALDHKFHPGSMHGVAEPDVVGETHGHNRSSRARLQGRALRSGRPPQ